MKFQPDTFLGTNAITRLDGAAVWVNGERRDGGLLVPWKGAVMPWDARSPGQLLAAHFDPVLCLKPELVIFGSGARLHFVSPALFRVLIEARIGVETMDTAAACRTFNVLAAEGRSVLAALLPVDAA
ncbi:MAG: MTH938/NDUFAF3 family protein [Aquincola sp.]|nr:MTH938/NDUFAF3 family protein [Aquincola sp.]MDH4288038.1 MTH938/NDUFAF3 family protein [Aquincola sp.]MDH5329840.1 MTH938/NDUFAF3 family protein [Aquincola sp.]